MSPRRLGRIGPDRRLSEDEMVGTEFRECGRRPCLSCLARSKAAACRARPEGSAALNARVRGRPEAMVDCENG